MSDGDYRIPIDTAHKVLATFGIMQPTKAYNRWVKDVGFDLKDFSAVLFESPFVFIVDWRTCLEDELKSIAKTLAMLEVPLWVELDEDGDTGHVKGTGTKRFSVAYRPSDASEFDDVISPLRGLHRQFYVDALIMQRF